MNLSLYQQTKPVGAGHSLVMALSKKSAVGIILHTFELPGAYTGQTQLHTFSAIDNVMWYYQLFESPDGSPSGVVRNYFDVEPNANTYATRDDLYLTADVSDFFASNTAGYGVDSMAIDTSLAGWNWSLERVGMGTREIGVKYLKTKVVAGVVTDTTNDDIEATGFRLLEDGDLIGVNEEWCIHFYPQLQAVSSPATSGVISATRILATNTSLDNTGIGISFWLKGSGGFFEVTLPDLATVPDNEPIYFMSDGGSHVNVSLKCFTGQTIQWYKNSADLASDTLATRIVLGQQQKLAMYKITMDDSSVRWLILTGFEDRNVGQIITQYSKIPINTIMADGREISRSTFAALWEYVQTLQATDPTAVIAKSAWENVTTFDGVGYKVNYGKYHLGDGVTTFGVPRIYAGSASGTGFLRFVDGGGRKAASFQVDTYPDHSHDTLSGDFPGNPNGAGPVKLGGGYNATHSQKTDLTGPPCLIVGSTWQLAQRAGFESRPVNFGAYGLIRI